MSHDKHEKHDKKHKKLQKLLQNLHLQQVNLQAGALNRERDLEREREEKKRNLASHSSRVAASASKGAEPVWSAKMQMIRDKNNGRTRMAEDRWNRFAGTESGGGHGR